MIIVLLVVAIMTVSIVEFSYSTRVDLHLAGDMRDSARALMVARAGLELAKGILNYDVQQISTQKGTIYYVPGPEVDFTKQFWSQACKFPPIPMDLDQGLTGEVRGLITDEGGKIPVNLLVDPKKGPPEDVNTRLETVVKRLLTDLGVDPNIAEAIEDYIDQDSIPRTYGAEASSDYTPKNAPLTTISELRMVKGMMEKGNDNEGKTPFQRLIERPSHGGEEGEQDQGLCGRDAQDSPFLTVYPRVFTTTAAVNILTAPLEVIMALFDLQESDAREVVRIRESKLRDGHPEAVLGAMAPPNTAISPKAWNEAYPLLATASSYFSIRAFGRIPNPAAQEGTEEENVRQVLALEGVKAVVKTDPQASPRLEMLYYRED